MSTEKHRILAVDDNAANLKLVTFLLSSSDYDLRTASNALDALRLVDSFRPELILLDLQLPDMDGLEVTRRLKADPRTSEIIIIALTAYAMKGDEERARAIGVDGYVTKPIEGDPVRRMIGALLAAHRTSTKRGGAAMGTMELVGQNRARTVKDEPLPAEEIVERYHRYDLARHPYFARLARGPLDLGAVWVLVANLREGISAHFVRWLAKTIERIDDRRISSLLAKQLNDELGNGDFERIHSVLLDRFVSELSQWRPSGTDDDLLRAGRRMADACGRPFAANEPYEGVGALVVGEVFAEKMDLCLADQMRRQSAVSKDALAWLDLHEKLEHDHAQDSTELAVLIPKEEAVLVAAWRGAAHQWEALWQFLDDVHDIAEAARG